MLTIVAHLTLIYADWFAAEVTVLGKHSVETVQTVRLSVAHYVPLTTQLLVALETGEMLDMPRSSLGFRAFVREYDLITCRAAWLQGLRMVSSAV